MQWLHLQSGTNQLSSMIQKLKLVKTSEKSREKSDFLVSLENHFFHQIFHSFSLVSASKSKRKVDLCPPTKKATAFSNLPYRKQLFFLNFLLLYLQKKEIWSEIIQNNIMNYENILCNVHQFSCRNMHSELFHWFHCNFPKKGGGAILFCTILNFYIAVQIQSRIFRRLF